MTEPLHLRTTRAAYDDIADLYADLFREGVAGQPVDRALLTAFAELVRKADAGPVADLGCGPGHVTAQLRALGPTVFGIDLSPAMITLARQAYPDVRFDEGSMTALDLADGVLGGVLAWYSIIHTPPESLPEVFAEFHRVTAPGGHLLLGFFQTNEEVEAFDHKVSLAYRWPIDRLTALLSRAGFAEVARLTREPEDGERFLHGRLIVRRPTG
ncbi:MAG TPA: class I SAM-dependent methyltransferase [Kribbella sp.]|jgi:SAM-dependent methyltransferase